jgi:hypothetical protein
MTSCYRATADRRFATRLSPLLTVLLLSACAIPSARMPAPAELANGAEVLEVGHRSRASGALVDESFEVGPYQVHHVKRGLSSAQGFGIGALSTESSKQHFRFEFKGRQDWRGRCELKARDTALQIGKVGQLEDSRASLQCSCASSDGNEMQLKLEDSWRPLRGSMTLGSVSYRMQQVAFGQGDGGPRSPAMGYRVEGADGRAVAAVEVLYPGRIWQQRDLPADQREPQACLLSGLMLYGAQ